MACASIRCLPNQGWVRPRCVPSIDTTDGNLGAHLLTLEGADYVTYQKGLLPKTQRHRVCHLSASGREAFARYCSQLHAMSDNRSLEAGPAQPNNTPNNNNNRDLNDIAINRLFIVTAGKNVYACWHLLFVEWASPAWTASRSWPQSTARRAASRPPCRRASNQLLQGIGSARDQ